jgi:hypothetical protein
MTLEQVFVPLYVNPTSGAIKVAIKIYRFHAAIAPVTFFGARDAPARNQGAIKLR